ncbi:multicopper oxidase family protein [Pseudonocardia sp. CA-107938]|uniref:multicopper oxidase family protein n=1 Tax=Pseudonocardia sp. CA-107938 TaxID=3240021 RepID=UPI003D906377
MAGIVLRRSGVIAAVLALAVLAPVAVAWYSSLLPARLDMATTGRPDLGGGAAPVGPARAVPTLTGPAVGTPDVDVTLTARREGTRYTLNGSSPGPQIQAVEGQLVQVKLVNESVAGGVTLHWHGLDVPNAEDGVAGVTQDAVPIGGEHVYRFVARSPGTYWYHSHQVAHDQVVRGLLGPLVIVPRAGLGATTDVTALVHIYDGVRTIDGIAGDHAVEAAAGATVRLRVINTDNGAGAVWISGAPFRVVAVDGVDVHGGADVQGVGVLVTAGGRADLQVTVPPGGVRLETGTAALVVGPAGSNPQATPRPAGNVDLLTYGTPAPLPFDATRPDRRFGYAIGRAPGFLDGVPGVWWTINGEHYPDEPMFMVGEGDVVVMHVSNDSGEAHPMHLHGHHAVVLARNGVAATGSPWWFDSLEVGNGESYDVALRADNPGVWMDHCHNLQHARDGLVTHLMYANVTTPFRIGDHENTPE